MILNKSSTPKAKPMKTVQDTTLLAIREGDLLMERDGEQRIGQLIDIQLSPNGVNDLRIVAILTVKFKHGSSMSATSEKFVPVDGELYCEKIYKL